MNFKPLSSKTRLLLSASPLSSVCPYSMLVSYFCTSSPATPSRSHSLRRHYEEESKNVRVSVWWDFENCHLPADVNVFKVAHSITAAVRASGIKGPIQITAFGDVLHLSKANQEALSMSGINLSHIPGDLMYWVSQNPPPVHLFLISGDRDFASVLHRLRMNNYNILLATSDSAPSVLCSAASIMWRWNALLKGENLTGKFLNQPPDGPYGSWYGLYKVPLEDPFSFYEQPCSQVEELTDVIPETIPKALIKGIRDILGLYPEGISIGDLRSELKKNNVSLGKDFYGYKKFSSFLLSMPDILKVRYIGDGQYVIRAVAAKPEPLDRNPSLCTVPVTSNSNRQSSRPLKPNGKDISTSGAVDRKSIMPVSPEISTERSARKVQQSTPIEKSEMDIEQPPKDIEACRPLNSYGEDISISGSVDRKSIMPASLELSREEPTGKVQQSPPFVQKSEMDIEQPPKEIEEAPSISEKVVEVANVQGAEDNLQPSKEQDSKSEVGFFKKIWRRWLRSNDDSSRIKGHDIPKEYHSSGDNSVNESENSIQKSGTLGDSLEKKEEKKILKSANQENGQVTPASSSSSSSDSTLAKETSFNFEPYSEKSGKTAGLLNLIRTWWKFGRNTPDSNSSIDHPGGELEQTNSYSVKHQIFYEDSFWKDLESFFNSQRGSILVSQSKTREQMARNLQKDGPSPLKSLNETDALRLVDILISEKKWVEEYPSEASPFKVTLCIEKNTSTSDSHASNGLGSISLSTPLQSKPNRQAEGDGDGSVGKDSSSSNSKASNGLRTIFLRTALQSKPKRLAEGDGNGRTVRIQNISHAGVSQPVSYKKPLERSRGKTLRDCQKLVQEILKDYPEGYNIVAFRKLFFERYGYHLDSQKFGFGKLASLLQIMPGVEIESTYMIPSNKVLKCSSQDTALSDIQESITVHTSATLGSEIANASNDDELDSAWEELGPVDNTVSSRKEPEEKCTFPHYESSLSDDNFSDSEGEPSALTRTEGLAKSGMNNEDSSLLQILDSWYGKTEGDHGKDEPENEQGMVDYSKNNLHLSESSGLGTKTKTSIGYGQKQRTQKSYSFVADPDSNPDKLVDGIMTTLKKSGESRMQS
ncbi:uncharacterized protein LOC105636602 isoform X2 [Jatropha curcas]|uniref:uncharacterized protein LOC105636602 isoform X2 n=1 Tax=Jatropha curcas TaxID=180498 RepID=UPI0005FADC55|nr:uncharacterized protein LOC105636602 isoform X2 [Jatropha curcas]